MRASELNILFLGDLVGRAGRHAVRDQLPRLLEKHSYDCIIANCENSAGGFGITETICDEMDEYGINVITLGNHTWDQREIFGWIHRKPHVVRPINYPQTAPGVGHTFFECEKGRILVINAMGRLFMDALDDPFRIVDDLLKNIALQRDCDAVIVDFHAEATSEKQAFATYLDGRVSLVVGTHTHVPTADHRIMPYGTGYQSDAGMCGDYDSILGMEKDEPVNRFVNKINSKRFETSKGEGTLAGLAIQTDGHTGLCRKISPIRLGGALSEIWPE